VRSTLLYEVREENDGDLRLALIQLGKLFGRCECRKAVQLVRIEHWFVNRR
jgi:hypothetical protein